jgi:hypothetical protein
MSANLKPHLLKKKSVHWLAKLDKIGKPRILEIRCLLWSTSVSWPLKFLNKILCQFLYLSILPCECRDVSDVRFRPPLPAEYPNLVTGWLWPTAAILSSSGSRWTVETASWRWKQTRRVSRVATTALWGGLWRVRFTLKVLLTGAHSFWSGLSVYCPSEKVCALQLVNDRDDNSLLCCLPANGLISAILSYNVVAASECSTLRPRADSIHPPTITTYHISLLSALMIATPSFFSVFQVDVRPCRNSGG